MPSPVPERTPPTTGERGELAAKEPAGTGFWLVAGRQGGLTLADLGSEWVIAGAGVMARLAEDGAFEPMPNMLRGLIDPGVYLESWELMALGGRWPDPVWQHAEKQFQRTSSGPEMYYRKGERWQRKATKSGRLDWYYHSFAPWTGEQVLALRLQTAQPGLWNEFFESVPASVQRRVDAALLADPPRFDVLVAGAAPTPAPMQIAAGGQPIHFTALPGGEVFVLIEFGETSEVPGYGVQRFASGASTGVLDRLTELVPASELMNPRGVAARAADELYLFGTRGVGQDTSLFGRFDGQHWTAISTPGNEVLSLAIADNVLWAVIDIANTDGSPAHGLWKRVGEGAWQQVALPQVRTPAVAQARWTYDGSDQAWREVAADPAAAADPRTVWPQAVHLHKSEIWVVGELADSGPKYSTRTRHVVLGPRPVPRVLELADGATLAADLRAASAGPKFNEVSRCGDISPWVRVATLPPEAPADAGVAIAEALVAATPRELLASFVTLRESEVDGRRVVGLQTRHTEAAVGEAILAALRGFRPAEEHRFECRDPRPIRSLAEFQWEEDEP